MGYVYDASFAGAIVIPDERNPKIDKARAAIGEDQEIFVPQLFWYEIANIFINLIRRRRFTNKEVNGFFPNFTALRLITDSETGLDYSKKLLRFYSDYNLSSYDAAYLELAERKKSVLCTLDHNLKIAAKKHGVKVL